MKKILFIIGALSCVMFFIYSAEEAASPGSVTSGVNYQNIEKSIVSIVEKKDMYVYRTDPYHFFDEVVGTVKSISGGGSGFFITKSGYILTSNHVVDTPGSEYIVILSNQDEYPAEIVYRDENSDIALIKITPLTDAFIPLEIGEDEVNIGEIVMAGNKSGVVNHTNLEITVADRVFSEIIQIDIPFIPGDSGLPLLSVDGNVIGIIIATSQSQANAGYITPINIDEIKKIIGDIH